ncbi:MAG: acyl-CoA thioesterase [Alistipes sp.]|nr:acyl-CoA thioesterase [Alistipes sp.]
MARTITTPIQQRFSDFDPFQHVNNVAQQMYFDVGKTEFFRQLLGEVLFGDLRAVTVSTSTSYLDQLRTGDVRVTTCCERIGNKSFTLFQQLFADERLCSESRTVLVAFDFPAQCSVPIPDRWRERLAEE